MPTWAFMLLKPKVDAVFARGEKAQDNAAALQGLVRFIEQAPSGQRNSCLYWAARRAAEGGFADDATQHMLADAVERIGINRKEAMKTIGSAIKAGRRLA
jgi:hypothetical protein